VYVKEMRIMLGHYGGQKGYQNLIGYGQGKFFGEFGRQFATSIKSAAAARGEFRPIFGYRYQRRVLELCEPPDFGLQLP
jgi:hypothetical protein